MLPNLYIFFHGNLLGQIKGGQKKKEEKEEGRKKEKAGWVSHIYKASNTFSVTSFLV